MIHFFKVITMKQIHYIVLIGVLFSNFVTIWEPEIVGYTSYSISGVSSEA